MVQRLGFFGTEIPIHGSDLYCVSQCKCVCVYIPYVVRLIHRHTKVLKLERIFLLKSVAARADQIIFLDLLVIVFLTHPRVLLAAFAAWLTAGSWSICCLPAGQPGGPFFCKATRPADQPPDYQGAWSYSSSESRTSLSLCTWWDSHWPISSAWQVPLNGSTMISCVNHSSQFIIYKLAEGAFSLVTRLLMKMSQSDTSVSLWGMPSVTSF